MLSLGDLFNQTLDTRMWQQALVVQLMYTSVMNSKCLYQDHNRSHDLGSFFWHWWLLPSMGPPIALGSSGPL